MTTLSVGRLRLTIAQRPNPMSKRGKGIYFFLTVEDVEEFYDFIVAGGIETYGEPEDSGWGGRYFVVVDPNGYRLFFVQWYADGPYLQDPGEPGELGLKG
jgi:uncharacterized glyoxalase superfamily protein PhnB